MSALSPVGQLLAQMRSAEREENPGVFRGDKKKGEPWFVAGDVCEVLGIENVSHALSRIKSVNIVSSDVENSRGQLRKTRIVNESGLYRLIFQSRKPEAEKFTDWVTGEVLPQIRKTGWYSKDVSPWLSTHPSQWHKTFPDAYFLQIFRLKGKRPPKDGNLKYTPWISHINNDLIYKPARQSWERRLTRPFGTKRTRSRSSCIRPLGTGSNTHS
jgi:prophage antirepressor-like protein